MSLDRCSAIWRPDSTFRAGGWAHEKAAQGEGSRNKEHGFVPVVLVGSCIPIVAQEEIYVLVLQEIRRLSTVVSTIVCRGKSTG